MLLASLGTSMTSRLLFWIFFWLFVAVAVVFAIQTASPNGFFAQSTTNWALPYFGISLSLNILLTLLIVGRMWYYTREGQAVFGHAYGKHYTIISSMFIESAALYAICSILLLATYAIQHPINQIWFGLSPSVQVRKTFWLKMWLKCWPPHIQTRWLQTISLFTVLPTDGHGPQKCSPKLQVHCLP